MCGIAGLHRRTERPIPKMGRLVDMLHRSIESRGRDASGYLAMLPNGKVQIERALVPASKFKRKRIRNEARSVLLHTRFATVGRKDDVRNAHPQINGGMAAVHNGTIYNHGELFDAFGLERHAQVDSEIIPALISFAGWENAAEAIDLFDGGAAFAVVSEQHPDEVILARTRSYPLVYFVTPDFIIWASTRQAIERSLSMTFGAKAPTGEWVEVPEWTMVRVNGTIETTTIRVPPKPVKVKKSKRSKRTWSVAPVARRQLVLDAPPSRHTRTWRPAVEEREPWMEEAVRDLQRIEGYSYAEAFDAVYGVEPDEDEDWLDRLLDEIEWSRD